ncbi:MAG: hypothetical protein U0457_08580 [Candidatus Sericytochromatia bacterium]
MTENLLPNSYKNFDEVLKTAQQIRRASVIVKLLSNEYKLFIINNKFTFEEEFLELKDIDKEHVFININDSYGNIKRKNVMLVYADVTFLAKAIRKYNPKHEVFKSKFGNASLKLKKLIRNLDKKEEEPKLENNRSGSFELKQVKIAYRFRDFTPYKLIINQVVKDEEYQSFSLNIQITSLEALEKIKNIFKGTDVQLAKYKNVLKNGKVISINFDLKEKILFQNKRRMFKLTKLEDLIKIRNPLESLIITDLSNYTYKSSEIL